MTYQHQSLAAGRWETLSFAEQMANFTPDLTIKRSS